MLFKGEIKVNVKNNYAYFGMDTATVRKALTEPFEELRIIMRKRNITGRLCMCRFVDFDGDFEHDFVIFTNIFIEGPHITLWMYAERIRNKSVNSIWQWVGRKGTFQVTGWQFIKTNSIILLVVSGNIECVAYTIY